MSQEEIQQLGAVEIASLCRAGEIKPSEVVGAALEAIDARDRQVGAFLSVFHDQALARARELDGENPAGRPLYGVPVALKDNICTRGRPTTCASRMLADYRPPYDATVVRRLSLAGAVIVGKTNMDEFAMGSSTEHSAFQRTVNPWDAECVPGGSSGGSAAAVAAAMVPLALGSDTGGSIRQPAAFCGVVGLKGTWGRVSRHGLVAFASSFDQIGPLASDVAGCAAALAAVAGSDGYDSTALEEPCPALDPSPEQGLRGLKIALPDGLRDYPLDPVVAGALDDARRLTLEAGGSLAGFELPALELSIASYCVIAAAEASSNLARFDGVRYGLRERVESLAEMYARSRSRGFGAEVKRRILLGTYVLSAGYYDQYYAAAGAVRQTIRMRLAELFAACDLLLLPTTPGPAFRFGEKLDDPLEMYLSDIFTTPASVAGLPAVSIPAGLSESGLPVAVQLVAAHGREDLLVRGAAALEAGFAFRSRCVPRHFERDGRSR